MLVEVDQLGLPPTVGQPKYDANIKAWPDGMPATPSRRRPKSFCNTLSNAGTTAKSNVIAGCLSTSGARSSRPHQSWCKNYTSHARSALAIWHVPICHHAEIYERRPGACRALRLLAKAHNSRLLTVDVGKAWAVLGSLTLALFGSAHIPAFTPHLTRSHCSRVWPGKPHPKTMPIRPRHRVRLGRRTTPFRAGELLRID